MKNERNENEEMKKCKIDKNHKSFIALTSQISDFRSIDALKTEFHKTDALSRGIPRFLLNFLRLDA